MATTSLRYLIPILLLVACTGHLSDDSESQVAVAAAKLSAIEAELYRPGTGQQIELKNDARAVLSTEAGIQAFATAFKEAAPQRRTSLLLLARLAPVPSLLPILQPAMNAGFAQHARRVGSDLQVDDVYRQSLISAGVFVDIYTNGGYDAATFGSLIDTIDVDIARYIGTLLAAREALTPELVDHFRNRGIDPTRFRALTPDEVRKVTTPHLGSKSTLNGPAPSAYQSESFDSPSHGAPRANVTANSILGIGTGEIGPGLGDPPCLASKWSVGKETFDTWISGWCNQGFFNDSFDRFHMANGRAGWGQAYGFDEPCNLEYPLARTFIRLFLLDYVGTWAPNCDQNGPLLNWASCYSTHIAYLQSVCEANGGYSALTTTYLLGIGNARTELYPLFFFNTTAIEAASGVFHEARHADAICEHGANCPAGPGGCDPSYGVNGCVGFGSGDGDGAYTLSVKWLWSYLTSAQSGFSNDTIRTDAMAAANAYLRKDFEADPCFRITDIDGHFETSCEFDPLTMFDPE